MLELRSIVLELRSVILELRFLLVKENNIYSQVSPIDQYMKTLLNSKLEDFSMIQY